MTDTPRRGPATIPQLQELMGKLVDCITKEILRKRKPGTLIPAGYLGTALDLLVWQKVRIKLDDETKTRLEKVGRKLLEVLEQRVSEKEITASELRVLMKLLEHKKLFVDPRLGRTEYLKLVSVPFPMGAKFD